MSGESDIDIFPPDLGYELAAGHVAIEINLVVFDLRLAFPDGSIR